MNKKKLLNIVLIICFVISLGCIALFFSTFHSMPISHKTSDWSNFGSYIAGTIGPLMSLISILFILKSIDSADDNHHELMRFSLNDKIHNQIKDLADTLKESLNSDYVFKDDNPNQRTPGMVIYDNLVQNFRVERANSHFGISSNEAVAIRAIEHMYFDFNPQIMLIGKLTTLLNMLTESDQEVYKLLIETKISEDQRAVIYCFACRDQSENAQFIRDHWSSFTGSIFNR